MRSAGERDVVKDLICRYLFARIIRREVHAYLDQHLEGWTDLAACKQFDPDSKTWGGYFQDIIRRELDKRSIITSKPL